MHRQLNYPCAIRWISVTYLIKHDIKPKQHLVQNKNITVFIIVTCTQFVKRVTRETVIIVEQEI